MELNCLDSLDADVNVWVDHWREMFNATGVAIVEAFDRISGAVSIDVSPDLSSMAI